VRATVTNVNSWTTENAGIDFANQWVIAAVAALFILFLLMRETIYEALSEETATVMAKTMEDEHLLDAVRSTIVSVTESPEAIASVSLLVQRVLHMPETQTAINNVAMHLVRVQCAFLRQKFTLEAFPRVSTPL
jgi:hypothetical protein